MKLKIILISLGFILGLVSAGLISNYNYNNIVKVTYLQDLEINDYSPEMIQVRGTYLTEQKDIHMVSLECHLLQDMCLEVPVFITKDGVTGIVSSKEFKIIEKSATRIVAKYEGLAAFHMYTIDLATKEVTFKNEAINNSNDTGIYKLENGNAILKKVNE